MSFNTNQPLVCPACGRSSYSLYYHGESGDFRIECECGEDLSVTELLTVSQRIAFYDEGLLDKYRDVKKVHLRTDFTKLREDTFTIVRGKSFPLNNRIRTGVVLKIFVGKIFKFFVTVNAVQYPKITDLPLEFLRREIHPLICNNHEDFILALKYQLKKWKVKEEYVSVLYLEKLS